MHASATDMLRVAERSESVAVAGASVLLDVTGALWWPRQETLVVSDLHLEKGSSFAQRGVPLPPYDTRATLSAIERLVEVYQPETVISLGDSFHDAACERRMAGEDIATLRELVGGVGDWIWVVGNHDPIPPARLGGRVLDEVRIDTLSFRHEPTAGGEEGEIAGHLHPCARVRRHGRSVRRACFVTDSRRLVMPALGAYAGGLSIRDAAFDGLFAQPPAAYMLGRDRVWRIAHENVAAD